MDRPAGYLGPIHWDKICGGIKFIQSNHSKGITFPGSGIVFSSITFSQL